MPKFKEQAALHYKAFRYFLGARFSILCAYQAIAVGIGQFIYLKTHNPLDLGFVGLAIFLPKFTLNLFTGHVADHYNRRRIIYICRFLQGITTLFLIAAVHADWTPLWLLYSLLFLMGTCNAFDGPASLAIVTQIVPDEHFHNAVTWNSSIMQLAFVIGPIIGGTLYAIFGSALPVFYTVAFLRFFSSFCIYKIKVTKEQEPNNEELSLKTLFAGIRYVFKKKVILGSISLDLFAVLLGGATALMPIFANDILHVGPSGLGVLRAAPGIGAGLMALLIAQLPPMKRAGDTLLWCVGIFGAFTVLFGISKNFYFSLFCLAMLGAADMVSVVIRGVLVQMKTPPAMRGRVSAIDLVFIGASNEIGEFESGLTASWFGTVPSVILGGVGTIVMVLLHAWGFPEIRNCKKIDEITYEEEMEALDKEDFE